MTHDIINIKESEGEARLFQCPACHCILKIKNKSHQMGKVTSVTCPKCKAHFNIRLVPDEKPKPDIPLAEGTILAGQVGVYTIRQVLGRGSFGISYLADAEMSMQYDDNNWMGTPKVTKRTVVVKEYFMMNSTLRHPNGKVDIQSRDMHRLYYDAFKNEAKMLRQMHNEHIVTVYDHFEANNTTYYVMEYFEGGTLAQQWNGRHSLDDERKAIDIMLQVAYGVEYLHACGFVHLDIKPQNIMRRSDGTWVLIDFGIARPKRWFSTTSAEFPLAGSAHFAPIEQFGANPPQEALPLMDIYALGATFYWLCDGMPPEAYEVLTHGLPMNDWMHKGITPQTIRIIEKAMQPVYTNRYGLVGRMIDELLMDRDSIDDQKESRIHQTATSEDTQYYQETMIPKSLTSSHIYDNEYDGHTIIHMTIQQIKFVCEIGKNTKPLEKVLDDMMPSACGLIAKHPTGPFDGVWHALAHLQKLQFGTSLRFQLPSDITLERWAEKHPQFTTTNPILCFNGAHAVIYAATINRGKITVEEADIKLMWIKYDLLLELNQQKIPFEFIPSEWSFGFHPACKNGKWGLLRDDKKIVTAADFDKMSPVGLFCLPGPGPAQPFFIGCRAEKGDTLFFYELSPMLTMKLKACLTREEFDRLADMT